VSASALVTGADSGIGRATALKLADAGLDVGVTYNSDREGAERTAAEVRSRGRRAVVAHLDLTEPAAAADALEALLRRLSPIRVLVNNAGVNRRCPALDETLAAWQRVMAVNLTGPFVCARLVAREMVAAQSGGRIINVTSVHEHVPLASGAAYCAAKAGLGLLTKVLALELAPYGITVNAVAPGHTATPMNGYEGRDPVVVSRDGIPIKRVADPMEIASVIAHLASPAASYVTGASWTVDGGLTLMAAVPLQQEVESELLTLGTSSD